MVVKFNNRKRKKSIIKKRHIGEIRKSQLMNTFGIGSMVDFVRDTAIIGGADNWDEDESFNYRQITNENLQALTGKNFFLEPKTSDGNKYAASEQDIKSFIFPRNFYCPICKSIINYNEVKAQTNRHKCNQYNDNGKQCKGFLVSSRFVIICENGHIDDFPFSWWVHRGSSCSSGKPSPRIAMYNIGDRSDAESLTLECRECNAKRSMVGVFNKNALSENGGYPCTGRHPHLGENCYSECFCTPVVRLRSSTSVYFPINYSALLIPPWSQNAIHQLELKYDNTISYITDKEKLYDYLKKEILPKCKHLSFEELLEAYQKLKKRREFGMSRTEADVFLDEYNILCKGTIENQERFSSRNVEIPLDFQEFFETISVLDRLVVTCCLSGFTRLYPYNSGEDERVAPLYNDNKQWLPAVELYGEGIFIKFKDDAIEKWCKQNADRYNEMKESLSKSFFSSPKFSEKYVMLHTFAHLFIRQLSNECGYSAASLSERIYSDFTNGSSDKNMNGILIYLSSSDSDGSLGGLVSVAEETELLNKVLKDMLNEARWCSADPLCSLSTHQGFASLNYAACHACTLLPETSCEFRNVLLDRVSIVGTSEKPEIGFLGKLIQTQLI